MVRFLRLLLCSLVFLLPCLIYAQYPGWTAKANLPGSARHRAVGISIGNRGYIGLGHINAVIDVIFDDWWEYDPGSNSWTQKASFPAGPRFHSSAFAIGNKGYAGMGRDPGFVMHNDLFEYNPITNTWTQKASLPGPIRRGAVGLTIGNKGYISTGLSSSGYLNDLWEYNPVSNTWTQKANFPGQARTSAAGFTIGNKGYIGTGDYGLPLSDFYEYNPATNTWTQKANVPPVPRMEACGFTLGNFGYMGTGANQQSGTNYQDFWKYDPAANTWTQVQEFAGAARRYMSSFTIGTRAYCGLGTSGINYNDFWEYGNLTDVPEIIKNKYTVSVTPNPIVNSGVLKIESDEILYEEVNIVLLDISGKEVRRMKGAAGSAFIIEKNGLPQGIYLYKVFSNSLLLIGAGKITIQ